MDIEKNGGVETTLIRDVLPVKQAQLLASVAGADVNDLYFNEPTMADYQTITSPVPPLPKDATTEQVDERSKLEAQRDAFSVIAVVKNGAGAKVLKTEHLDVLPASIGAKLINIAAGITLAVVREGAQGATEAIKKIAPQPDGEKKSPPSVNST